MSDVYGDSPVVEQPDPFVASDAADEVSLDSEIDYDDEQDEDQLPLDVVEAIDHRGTVPVRPDPHQQVDDALVAQRSQLEIARGFEVTK